MPGGVSKIETLSQSLLCALKDGYNLFGCERSNTSQRNIFPVSHWREKQRRRVSGWILIRLERDWCVRSCQQTRSPAASEMVPLTQPWMLFHSSKARFNFRPKPYSLSAILLSYNLIETSTDSSPSTTAYHLCNFLKRSALHLRF